MRCSYCHATDLPLLTCSGCGTKLHAECRMKKCPTLGCSGRARDSKFNLALAVTTGVILSVLVGMAALAPGAELKVPLRVVTSEELSKVLAAEAVPAKATVINQGPAAVSVTLIAGQVLMGPSTAGGPLCITAGSGMSSGNGAMLLGGYSSGSWGVAPTQVKNHYATDLGMVFTGPGANAGSIRWSVKAEQGRDSQVTSGETAWFACSKDGVITASEGRMTVDGTLCTMGTIHVQIRPIINQGGLHFQALVDSSLDAPEISVNWNNVRR